jgi:hypothetical protein
VAEIERRDGVQDGLQGIALVFSCGTGESVAALVALEEWNDPEAIPPPSFLCGVRRPAGGTLGVRLLNESEGHEQLSETVTGLRSIGLPQTRAMSIFVGGRIRVLGFGWSGKIRGLAPRSRRQNPGLWCLDYA